MPNTTRVLVLQHPDEAKHPLNTARLAVLGLQSAQLWEGVEFDQLQHEINLASGVYLLFPSTDEASAGAAQSQLAAEARVALTAGAQKPHSFEAGLPLLIVPDGTWRKARQIVRANPVLHALPRISFAEGEPSDYRVRKAREPSALSTIEAIVRALQSIEPEADFSPLLKPFKVMIDQQIHAMGPDIYQRHHAR